MIDYLSGRQYEIMEILWRSDEPLTVSQIVKGNENLTVSTVQAAVRRLLSKGYMEKAGAVSTRTVLAMSYKAAVTKEAYLEKLGQFVLPKGNRKAPGSFEMIAMLIENETDPAVLDQVEEMVKKAKEKLLTVA